MYVYDHTFYQTVVRPNKKAKFVLKLASGSEAAAELFLFPPHWHGNENVFYICILYCIKYALQFTLLWLPRAI